MKKVLHSLRVMSVVPLTLISYSTFANVSCGEKYVELVMQRDDNAYIQVEGQGWQILGNQGDSDYDDKLGKAVFAKEQGLKVQLSYDNKNVDKECTQFSAGTVVKKIKVIKHSRK